MKLTKQEYIDILQHYDINFSKNLPLKFLKALTEKTIAGKLCRCIKKVKAKYDDSDEKRAIGICNYSVINRKKLKINGFSCKKKNQLKALKNKPNGDKISKVEKNIFLNKTKKKKKLKKINLPNA